MRMLYQVFQKEKYRQAAQFSTVKSEMKTVPEQWAIFGPSDRSALTLTSPRALAHLLQQEKWVEFA